MNTEQETSAMPSTEEVVAQLLEENQPDVSLEQESVEAEADTAETIVEDEKSESVGLTNLRNHAESLESDINNLYKPVYSFVDEYGGLEAVKNGLGLFDALQEYNPEDAANKFLETTWNISPERYSAVVKQVFKDHGKEFLETQSGKGTQDFDWKELDENDPVKSLIDSLQTQLEERDRQIAEFKAGQESKAAQAAEETRLNEFFTNRYKPLNEALSKLDFGDQTPNIKTAIQHTVEGFIESDEEAMRLFNEAAEMVREGNGSLATRRIAEFDRKSAEYIAKAIGMFSAAKANAAEEIKQKIENTELPRAAAATASATPVRATPTLDDSKPFDEAAQLAKLRQLEASGRFGK